MSWVLQHTFPICKTQYGMLIEFPQHAKFQPKIEDIFPNAGKRSCYDSQLGVVCGRNGISNLTVFRTVCELIKLSVGSVVRD